MQAVGAWKAGLKGMIVPRSNLDDLKGDDWPGGESPSETLRQQWAEAREQLVFRGVDTVEELLAFFFPSLAPLLTASGSSVRRSARCAPEVGPIASVGLPVPDKAWPGLAYAEACVLRGVSASPWPVRSRYIGSGHGQHSNRSRVGSDVLAGGYRWLPSDGAA